MSYKKPFHRNYRPVVSGPNSGYSDWAYIVDREYSTSPEHFTRAFGIIQEDILKLFEFIEPADANLSTYSFRIHELFMRICIEIETNFKAILRENTYNPIFKSGKKQGEIRPENLWNIKDFQLVNKTHHLDNYGVEFPFWKGSQNTKSPFLAWSTNAPITWYQSYNMCKHDRINNFHLANFNNLMEAYAGLFVILSSQFRTESFSTGTTSLGVNIDSYYSGNFGLGGFLMINFPKNWSEEEKYGFDWSELKERQDRFDKFNYDALTF